MSIKRLVDPIARILVGGLLIFSGLIKLNDPVGTEIKMEEYFEVFVDDFGTLFKYFIPWSMEIGFFMIVLEIVLGVAILLHYRMRLTTWVLLAMMVFFTFLTFYSAYFNKVTDCGCFGDAIKLTPWESFYKDVFLMVFVLHLFWYRGSYTALLRSREGGAVVLATAIISTFLGVYAIRHLPFIDFRPYKIGNHIPDQMKSPAQPIIEYTFVKDGEEVQSQQYLDAAQGYEYKSSRVINEADVKPKITDYAVTSVDGEDITQSTFAGTHLFIIMYDVRKSSIMEINRFRDLTTQLDGKVDMMILTASSEALVEEFRHQHQIAVPYAYADATVLKTILRSNPGFALWKDGTVLGNWHYNDTPTATDVLSLVK